MHSFINQYAGILRINKIPYYIHNTPEIPVSEKTGIRDEK